MTPPKRLTPEQEQKIRASQVGVVYPDKTILALLAEIDALKAENEDLKVINQVLTNHSGKLESKLRSRVAKLREAIEKIGYWQSDARVCCFPVDCYELLAQDDSCIDSDAKAIHSEKDVSDEESGN